MREAVLPASCARRRRALELHAGAIDRESTWTSAERMPERVTIYRAAWVLPVAMEPIRQGAVMVGADGRIAAGGPRAAIEPPEGAEIVELGEAALLPGLVNVHAHPELSLFRGALEDLRFRDWILRLVGTKRAALVDADFDVAARWTMGGCLRAGMTAR